jgi:catechol 2,3-dioxygenase-like lactoylglutathione lyase family enzyme
MKPDLKVLFVAGFGPIVRDNSESQKFYLTTLGLKFKRDADYFYTQELNGVNHFALWPLSQAAQSCFGTDIWPSGIPIPQAWIEFDVENIEEATAQLQGEGHRLFVKARTEPWGQVVTRLLSPEGLLVGLTVTPSMREEKK